MNSNSSTLASRLLKVAINHTVRQAVNTLAEIPVSWQTPRFQEGPRCTTSYVHQSLGSRTSRRSLKIIFRTTILACFLSASGLSRAESMSVSPNPSHNGDYTVSWTAVHGAQWYELYESINGGAWGDPVLVSNTSKSYTDRAAGSYKYRIGSCLTLGPPAYPNYQFQCGYDFGSVTVTVRPPVPTSLDGPSIDYNGDFKVTWNTAPGFTSKLRERLNSGGWSTVHSGSAESDSRWNRPPGNWRYGVRACLGSNCSNWSSSITVQVPAPPPAPTGLDGPTTDYNGAFTMSWNSSSGATTYNLYEFGPNNSTATYDVDGTTENIVEKLDAPGTYSYQVEGCNPESVCGPRSGFVDVVVEAPPDPPAELFPPPEPVPHDESYTISWNASPRSDTYELQEKPEGGAWQTVSQSSELSRTLSHDPGVYWYQVRGCHEEDVCSVSWSPAISVTVKLAFTTTYEYDAQGRLKQVKHPHGVVTDYVYDSAGNRTSKESSLEN